MPASYSTDVMDVCEWRLAQLTPARISISLASMDRDTEERAAAAALEKLLRRSGLGGNV